MKRLKCLSLLVAMGLFASPVLAMDMSMPGMTMKAKAPPPPATGHTLGGPFALTDQDGHAVTDRTFPGYKLVYFGYTTCPDACPLDLKKIDAALKALGPAVKPLPVLFITTDPERDTPKVLKSYLAAYRPAVTGLTGTPAQVAQVEKEYGVYAEKVWNKDKTDYMVNHTTYIYLMDPDNHLRDVFDSHDSADKIAEAIRAETAAP